MQIETQITTHENLTSQLTQFGLNPSQWNVHLIDDQKAHVFHRDDQEICLTGIWDKNQQTWRTLELSDF